MTTANDIRRRAGLPILSEAAYPLLKRWTDEKAALAYLRTNTITPRVTHFVPQLKKLTTGISTSMFPTRWTSGGPICFVLDGSRLPNRTIAVNGQATYTLTQQVQFMRAHNQFGPNDLANYKSYLHGAVHGEPDEVFVIGKITDLTRVLKEIRIKRGQVTPSVIAALHEYGRTHNITVTESEFHYTRESTSLQEAAKMRPSQRDLAFIRKMREEIRCGEGGGGYCHFVSEIIYNKFGWEQAGGVYCSAEGEPICSSHRWNILPDGAILDATADQLGEDDIVLIPVDDPRHKRYRLEYDIDYNPGLAQDY